MTTNTHAAGTANVKEDFQAIGDGTADDTAAIQAAFDSDYDTIIFPQGEYKFTDQLSLTTGNKTIIGEKATLFTDDDFLYTGLAGVNGWAIRIQQTSSITIKGLRVEARQTETPSIFIHLVGIMTASQIHFDDCEFHSVPNLANEAMTAIDFFSGWHDVSVTNSLIDLQHDSPGAGGGGIYFRDAWGLSASNATFTGNIVYKYTADEILWISRSHVDHPTATVENVTVSDNRLYFGDPVLVSNTYTIGFNGNGPSQVKNVKIFNNEIIGQGRSRLIEFESCENVEVYNNDLYTQVEQHPTSVTGGVFGSRTGAEATSFNTPGTVKVHHNRTIALDSDIEITGITYGFNPFDVTDNPHITIKAPSTRHLVQHTGNFSGNTVTVHGNIDRSDSNSASVFERANTANDNTIHIDGFIDRVIFQRWNNSLTQPVTYSGNHITTTKKHAGNQLFLYSMTGSTMTMANHPITISNNTIVNGTQVELDQSLPTFTLENTGTNTITDRTPAAPYAYLWNISIVDATPATQTLNLCNNTLQGFRALRNPDQINATRYPTVNLNCN